MQLVIDTNIIVSALLSADSNAFADEFQRGIEKEFTKMVTNAKFYQKTYILYRGYDIYKKIFKPSLIFYIVKEQKREVHILRVLREERDWGNILKTQKPIHIRNDNGVC